MHYDNPEFWFAIGQIVWIDILLSGDNAVVIALACRSLSGRTRWWGMVLGSGAAVGLRIAFTGVVTTLLDVPYLKFAGALALLFVAVDLVRPKAEEGSVEVNASETLWRAVFTIVVADFVMSLDNVVAIAAVAQGSWLYLIFGLALSIPMIIWGSLIIVKMLDRLPMLVWAGGGLLGWIAGKMAGSDLAAIAMFGGDPTRNYEIPGALTGIALVLGFGLWLTYKRGVATKP